MNCDGPDELSSTKLSYYFHKMESYKTLIDERTKDRRREILKIITTSKYGYENVQKVTTNQKREGQKSKNRPMGPENKLTAARGEGVDGPSG